MRPCGMRVWSARRRIATTLSRTLDRTFFSPAPGGAWINVRGASLFLNDDQVQALVDWLIAGRPDQRPAHPNTYSRFR